MNSRDLEEYLMNLRENPQKITNNATLLRPIFLRACSPSNGQARVRYALFKRLLPHVTDDILPGALIHACNFIGTRPVSKDHLKIIESLISRSGPIVDTWLLYETVIHKQFKVMEMLLKAGAPADYAMREAVKRKDRNAIYLMRKYGVTSTMKKPKALKRRKPVIKFRKVLPQCKDIEFHKVHGSDVHTLTPMQRIGYLYWLGEDLRSCTFAPDILSTFKARYQSQNRMYIFAWSPKSGKCVAAAQCDEEFDHVEIEFLCSSKTCHGAGTLMVKYVSEYARQIGKKYITLYSAKSAIPFYNKIGLSRTLHNRVTGPITRKQWIDDGNYHFSRSV